MVGTDDQGNSTSCISMVTMNDVKVSFSIKLLWFWLYRQLTKCSCFLFYIPLYQSPAAQCSSVTVALDLSGSASIVAATSVVLPLIVVEMRSLFQLFQQAKRLSNAKILEPMLSSWSQQTSQEILPFAFQRSLFMMLLFDHIITIWNYEIDFY